MPAHPGSQGLSMMKAAAGEPGVSPRPPAAERSRSHCVSVIVERAPLPSIDPSASLRAKQDQQSRRLRQVGQTLAFRDGIGGFGGGQILTRRRAERLTDEVPPPLMIRRSVPALWIGLFQRPEEDIDLDRAREFGVPVGRLDAGDPTPCGPTRSTYDSTSTSVPRRAMAWPRAFHPGRPSTGKGPVSELDHEVAVLVIAKTPHSHQFYYRSFSSQCSHGISQISPDIANYTRTFVGTSNNPAGH